ncbi:hypothetical protein JAAARDRAFT_34860 [Jaapia argillacea MUCL 33604]|uniref:Uncharacterized protein n=1 Tax=Jaapia argillacea MUCL 33604 TaxID=933084 RepID=A0A067PTK8_9AGAM|nr:hypothetical protein JAAARDRAFT_34860 [Jaapia argillacea MUCL 33604]
MVLSRNIAATALSSVWSRCCLPPAYMYCIAGCGLPIDTQMFISPWRPLMTVSRAHISGNDNDLGKEKIMLRPEVRLARVAEDELDRIMVHLLSLC